MFFDRKRDERNAVDLDIPIANEEKKIEQKIQFRQFKELVWWDWQRRWNSVACIRKYAKYSVSCVRVFASKKKMYRKNASRLPEAVSITRTVDGSAYVCRRHRLSGIHHCVEFRRN